MRQFIETLARGAGEICNKRFSGGAGVVVEYKSTRDLVTAFDREVESHLRRRIGERFPDHAITGEEQGTGGGNPARRWVIDPIDGTTSFVHGLPGFSVSIAYEEDGNTVAAAVYGPQLGQMFSAERGAGAFLNGAAITVSTQGELLHSLWATGFACLRAGIEPNNLPLLGHVLPRIRDVRRMGSAALDLCYVAAGKLDGYWEMQLNEYDVAAGALIVAEAGGMVRDMAGGGDFPARGILACNGRLGGEMTALLAAAGYRAA